MVLEAISIRNRIISRTCVIQSVMFFYGRLGLSKLSGGARGGKRELHELQDDVTIML
jgi:hypothetical protein